MYTLNGDVNLTGGSITVGTDEAVGVFSQGSGQTIENTGTVMNIGNNSFGFVNVGGGNTVKSQIASTSLGRDSIYIYSRDIGGIIENSTNITEADTYGNNYGIYSAGTVTKYRKY